MANDVKLNKKHGGKEFKSFFHFVGKVNHHSKYDQESNSRVQQPFLEEGETRTNKPKKKLQFEIETAKDNNLKVELQGIPFDKAYVYSKSDKKAAPVNWNDRFDKEKYPNETYHLIDTDWDKVEKFNPLIVEGAWVEVKGHYEFGSFHDSERGKVNFRKRIIDDVTPIENGQEIKAGKTTLLDNYVTDFKSDDFKEINFVSMQIGINTVYQEDESDDTTINAFFLDYGKERSTPYQTQLIVPYIEPEEGKAALSEAFKKLERLDFVEVQATDNNRPIFSNVEVEVDEEQEDPFTDVGEENKAKQTKRAISGSDKGIKISTVVNGSFTKEYLTEDEVKEPEPENKGKDNPFENNSSESEDPDNPFNNTNATDDDPFL